MGKINLKRCSKCNQEKPETDFYKDQRWCKECQKYDPLYYRKNREVILKNQKKYYENNSEKRIEYTVQWQKDNSDKVSERGNRRRKKYPEGWKEWRRRRNEDLREYKLLKGCEICGYNKYADVLSFHHNNGDKNFNISWAISRGIDLEEIKKEMKKCVVLCRNCHAELHMKERGIIK